MRWSYWQFPLNPYSKMVSPRRLFPVPALYTSGLTSDGTALCLTDCQALGILVPIAFLVELLITMLIHGVMSFIHCRLPVVGRLRFNKNTCECLRHSIPSSVLFSSLLRPDSVLHCRQAGPGGAAAVLVHADHEHHAALPQLHQRRVSRLVSSSYSVLLGRLCVLPLES
jgi:hypothetical protein